MWPVLSNTQINDSHAWFFLVNQKLVSLDSYEPFLFSSFPGGMKPNTLVLGFYDNCYPEDYFLQDPVFCQGDRGEGDDFGVDLPSLQAYFPPVRHAESPRALQAEEYVSIIQDAIKMDKNVCLGRYFFQLPPETKGIRGNDNMDTIDVWPTNLLSPGSASYADVSSLFLLQMACVLNMANRWRRARLRIFVCVESESEDQGWLANEEQFRDLLGKLRIRAAIKIVAWDNVARMCRGPNSEGQKWQRTSCVLWMPCWGNIALRQRSASCICPTLPPVPSCHSSTWHSWTCWRETWAQLSWFMGSHR